MSNGLHLFDDHNVSRRVEPWVKGRGPGDLFEKLGGNKAFWGGVNAEVILQRRNPARIDAKVKTSIETLGSAGEHHVHDRIVEEIQSN